MDRSNDFVRRRKFVQLVEDVKKFGAEVAIFSSMHESGERMLLVQTWWMHADWLVLTAQELNQLTGLAAILTYPLDIEDVQEEERLLANRPSSEVL